MKQSRQVIVIIFKDGQRRDISVKNFSPHAVPDDVLEDVEKHFPELRGIKDFDYDVLVDGESYHERELLGQWVTIVKFKTKMPVPTEES